MTSESVPAAPPPRAVVFDTNALGLGLVPGREAAWEALAQRFVGTRILCSFVTAAELRFGARRAGWGERRLAALEDRLVQTAEVVWPGPRLVASYVEVRASSAERGHGLAAKAHEADRWVAATALYLGVPLTSDDSIFENVAGLEVQPVTIA